ncbi:hypothetical protein D3C86_1396990 [compost metagenome]
MIELDGAIHDDVAQNAYDRERDAILTSLGYKVIRFDNKDVMQNITGVLQAINCSSFITRP